MENGRMVCRALNTQSLKSLESMLIPVLPAGTFNPSLCYFFNNFSFQSLIFSHITHLIHYVINCAFGGNLYFLFFFLTESLKYF